MTRSLRLTTCLTILLMIITVSGSSWAQESPETALEEAGKKIESEQIEANKNLRDSVNENLESIQQDAQTSSELKMAQEALETAQEQQATQTAAEQTPTTIGEPPVSPDQVPTDQQIEKKSIIDRMQAIPRFLQSVPERIPFIRDRNLIFFGRTEIDFAYYSSGVTSDDTGIYENVIHQYIGAFEIAGARGSFMFRGEFFRAMWDRTLVKDPVFGGFYVQASWVLTGEEFKYTQGKFVRIRPQNPRGAWEVAARFSSLDLNDLDVKGGEEKNLTIGLNWYSPGNQFRMMSNLIFVRTDENAGNENPTIFQIRAQFHC